MEQKIRIAAIENPIDRLIAFIEERETIRVRRAKGFPWPWTQDTILQTYRFTNIHREDDAVSLHYQKTVRTRYHNSPLVFPGTVFYRWFNRPTTCNQFFDGPGFERYMDKLDIMTLLVNLNQVPPPHVTGAYIINGMPGFSKGIGVIHYFHEWCSKPWKERWELWQQDPPMLEDIYEWLRSPGLGSFMRGQIIADLKYLPFLKDASDWWTWAASGPGSRRGLNVVLNRVMGSAWTETDWLRELTILNKVVTPILKNIGIDRLHNQDLQNCLCEFSKYTKVARGLGRPRQVFRHA